jgi:hypothetical protein
VRWPWSGRRRHAESAAEADRRLAELHEQSPRVEQLARELEARRKANRFSEAVREAFGGQ